MLNLNDDQRQNLTTYCLMGGAMVLTVGVGVVIYILRYSWPEGLLTQLAPQILEHLAYVAYALLALVGIMVVAQAVIATGGKLSGKFGGAEFTAEAEQKEGTLRVTTKSDLE